MKLLLGGGQKKVEGYINIDIIPWQTVDIVHNLDDGLKFINTGVVDEIVTEHVIEHLNNFILFMREVHRVCKDGTKVYIVTPHADYKQFWRDPTHIRPYTEETWRYFDDWNIYGLPKFKILSCDISDLEQMRVVLEVVK